MISQSYSQIRATIIKDIYNTLVEKGYQPDEVNLLEIDKEFSTTYIDDELKLCKCRIIKVHSTPYELTFTVDYEYNEDKRDINSIHFSVDDLFSILEEIDDLPTYNEAYDVEKKKKYLVNVHHDLTICLEVEAVSEEEACKLAEDKAECIEYEQPYAENGQLVNEGWTCVNVDSSIIDEIK